MGMTKRIARSKAENPSSEPRKERVVKPSAANVHIKTVNFPKSAEHRQTTRTPAEQRAEIERVAREHGADLSEEGFNEALRKVGKKSSI